MMMKTTYRRGLCLVLALAAAFSLAACSKEPAEPAPSEPGIPGFINTLTAPEYQSNSTPVEPAPELAEKLKDAVAQNTDVVGWLNIPNTTIDEPVVQTNNNTDYFRRDWLGNYQFSGCYWVDYECNVGARTDLMQNTIIYGHNLNDDKKDGVKFAQLMNFADLEFAKNNPYIYFSTPTDDMTWQVFAAFYTDTKLNYIKPTMSVTDYNSLLTEAKLRSEHNYDVNVTVNDKILTLSTCTYKYGARTDQRFVIMAKLLPAGAKTEATVNVTSNPNPKAPQF
ncbi:MAG: class B sortase [Oscillospiraceae bacterium]|nr:class B sortase [Oscillospiraceae bacterium]